MKTLTTCSYHIWSLTIGRYGCNLVTSVNTKFALFSFPSKYNGPLNCVYYFLPSSRRSRVKFTFLYLDILDADCSKDRIEIYDGITTITPTRRICKDNKVVEFVSSKGSIKMTYIGKSVGKYRGFHASVTFF